MVDVVVGACIFSPLCLVPGGPPPPPGKGFGPPPPPGKGPPGPPGPTAKLGPAGMCNKLWISSPKLFKLYFYES